MAKLLHKGEDMLQEYDSVRLIAALPDTNVPVGSKGVVLMVYKQPRIGYEVEFFDEHGEPLGNFTTDEYHLELRSK